MRYERKYRVESLDLSHVKQAVRNHPVSFRTLFPDRQVNNLYLDTSDLHFFQENLAGVAIRRKYRIRWYGESLEKVEAPVLEVKLKEGELGEKLTLEMPNFEIANLPSYAPQIDDTISRLRSISDLKKPAELFESTSANSNTSSKIDLAIRETEKAPLDHPLVRQQRILHPQIKLRPSLMNTYLRSYLISADGRFRLTIDREMNYHSFNARQIPHRRAVQDAAFVLEIKYESDHDSDYSALIGQRLPFRLGKNSKYVNGLLLVGNV